MPFKKSFIERFSPRGLRILFSAISFLVLALCSHNLIRFMITETTGNDQCAWRVVPFVGSKLLITDVVRGGVAEVAGLKENDTLLAINGQHFTGSNIAQGILNKVPRGQWAMYTINRNGVLMQVPIQILKLFDVRSLATWLLGFGFLIVGYIVVMTRPTGKIQRLFAWYGILAMLYFGLFAANVNPAQNGAIVSSLYGIGLICSRIFAPIVFFYFFYNFPVRRPEMLARRWARWVFIGYSIATTLVILFSGKLGLSQGLITALFFNPLYFFLGGLIVFARSYFTRVERGRRNQLRPILIASAIDIAIFTYAFILLAVAPFAFLLNPVAIAPLFLIVVLPISFGYSIFRYRLMDIDLIIKRSLIYGSITATIAAVYLLVVVGAGQLITVLFGHSDNSTLNILAFVVIALIFDPVKRWAQSWIDRKFYQDRLDYQKALLEFSRDLPRQMNLEAILFSMINTISTAMRVEKVGVALCDEAEGCLSVSQNILPEHEKYIDRPGGLIALLRETRKAQSLGLVGDESDTTPIDAEDKTKIIASGVVLAVPMFMKDRLIGSINVGPKLSGKVYSQEDIDLLATVAGQAAIAIENARLHRSEVEKERMEEEMTIARRIQQGLLPKSNPVVPGLDVSGTSIPALSVGGDYFDFIRLKDGRLLVVVADVSGKGMSAALYMSKIQGMIQLAAHMYTSPKEMLTEVNRRIYEGIERKSFITMILGLFDMNKNEVIVCRAGHNKALIGQNGSLRYEEGSGIGLGLEKGIVFDQQLEEVRHQLDSEKLFVFYSDGLTEAMNDKDEQFGEDKVFELVQSNRALSANQMQQTILRSVDEFRGKADVHDDITLVIVKTSQTRG